MKTIQLRDVTVGTGIPKVIIPITALTAEGILISAKEIKLHSPDIVEWRADFFEDVFDAEKVIEVLGNLRAELDQTPLLFTFRTKKEGGEKDIAPSEYTRLNELSALSGYADAVDVELFSGDAVFEENIKKLHDAGVAVVGSSHDFLKTPDKADLIIRLRKMQHMGADILKIAVMPKNAADVLVLLSACEEMRSKYADRPIAAISMSGIGAVSRICGEVFGSAVTFGLVGRGSAPGQLEVAQLRTVLDILHQSL